MRELVFGPRQSGRTTTLVLTMLEEMDMHSDKVLLVVAQHCVGYHIRELVRKYNGDPSRVQIVTLKSLHTLRGIDPRNVYIEHTAYEYADHRELQELYFHEDRKYEYLYGV